MLPLSFQRLSYRSLNLAGVAGSVMSMLFAVVVLQKMIGLEPCPLCMIDRVLVVALGLIFLVAALHNPGKIGQRIYAMVATLVSLAGVAVCLRHIWLQHLPADEVPTCAPGLDYMLQALPLSETLQIIFTTSGECAHIDWTLLGFTLPEQTLAVFAGFLLLSLLQMFRKPAN